MSAASCSIMKSTILRWLLVMTFYLNSSIIREIISNIPFVSTKFCLIYLLDSVLSNTVCHAFEISVLILKALGLVYCYRLYRNSTGLFTIGIISTYGFIMSLYIYKRYNKIYRSYKKESNNSLPAFHGKKTSFI